MSELKACPFCGSDSVTWQSMGEYTRTGCVDCGAEVTRPMGLYRNAMIEWNTRPIEDALQARAEKAEAMVELLIELGDVINGDKDSVWTLRTIKERWTIEVAKWKERE